MRTLNELTTPAAIIDLDVMTANLDRMAQYAQSHNIALRPHTKTHKTPELAAEQIRRGAAGVTVATVREAEIMSTVADDILLAYPPVGAPKLQRLLSLPERVRITVALDSLDALDALARAAAAAGRAVGVLVEADLGMHRVGVSRPDDAVALARAIAVRPPLQYCGLQFYPGHIRESVQEQAAALAKLRQDVASFTDALARAGLPPTVVSGGSTPTAFSSHEVTGMTEMRPGTYIFNDRTTAAVAACRWSDCAYTILATVVSTAVHGQAVVDAGSKALSREELRGPNARGFGQLLDRPDVVVHAMSEEHGLLDLNQSDWRPRIGERVRIIPNHVCVSVNLNDRLWGVRGESLETCWTVAARGWG